MLVPAVVGDDFREGFALGGAEATLGVAEGDAVDDLGVCGHVEELVDPFVDVGVEGGEDSADALAPGGEEQVLGGGYYGGH